MHEQAPQSIKLNIKDTIELNLSYMPFIKGGGIFVPLDKPLEMGTEVILELQLPEKKNPVMISTKVVWQTPANALHYISPGVGLQFTGEEALNNKALIESSLDPAMEVGGYTYGLTLGGKE